MLSHIPSLEPLDKNHSKQYDLGVSVCTGGNDEYILPVTVGSDALNACVLQ